MTRRQKVLFAQDANLVQFWNLEFFFDSRGSVVVAENQFFILSILSNDDLAATIKVKFPITKLDKICVLCQKRSSAARANAHGSNYLYARPISSLVSLGKIRLHHRDNCFREHWLWPQRTVSFDVSCNACLCVSFNVSIDVSFKVTFQISFDVSFDVSFKVTFHISCNVSIDVYFKVTFHISSNVSFDVSIDVSFDVYSNVSFDVSFHVMLVCIISPCDCVWRHLSTSSL